MIRITLGKKTYTQEYIRALALREIEEPMRIMQAMQEDLQRPLAARELDVLINWFCLFFGNQFTMEDVLADYPADRLRVDILSALMHCQAGVTAVLHDFPTMAEAIPQSMGKGAL